MPDQQKIDFLLNELPARLRTLTPDTMGSWGRMNAQQMVEHFILAVKNASGKLQLPVVNQGEAMEKSRAFVLSDKLFKENTKNPLIDDPLPVHYPSMEAAVSKLEIELRYIVDTFQNNPGFATQNPFFGVLDFDQNIHLLHKHALHHLRQFGL